MAWKITDTITGEVVEITSSDELPAAIGGWFADAPGDYQDAVADSVAALEVALRDVAPTDGHAAHLAIKIEYLP